MHIFARHAACALTGIGLRQEGQHHEKENGQHLHEHSESRRRGGFRLATLLLLLSSWRPTGSKLHARSKAIGIELHARSTARHAASKKGVENVFRRHFLLAMAHINAAAAAPSSTTASIVGIFLTVSIINGSFLRIRQGCVS